MLDDDVDWRAEDRLVDLVIDLVIVDRTRSRGSYSISWVESDHVIVVRSVGVPMGTAHVAGRCPGPVRLR
jgi:hypothetical protein